jgi:hypothetical protein
MDIIKTVIIAAVVGLVIVAASAYMVKDVERVGGVPGVNLYPQTFELNTVDVNGSVTLTQGQSGSIIYSTTTAPSTTTLPAARPGLEYTFVVDGAIATGDWVIDSAEGDNIEGTLSVNNADVACSGEDQINFVTDGETIGDWVKLVGYSGGWIIVGSEAETAAKITCTDPT